ncbi:MAG TPA: hypothetical protein ENJ09_02925 [Planctomycetes bacterium]|nr:hypothetical protein [Planctomycetota bacterium]
MGSVTKRILMGTTLVVGVALLLFGYEASPVRWRAGVPWGVALVLSWLGAGEVAAMGGFQRPGFTALLRGSVVLTAGLVWWGRAGIGGVPALETPWAALLLAALFVGLAALVVSGQARKRSALLAVWVAVPLFGLVALGSQWGTRGLLILILLSKVGDIFGYFVGRAIGERRPFPNLSPGKTVAGCVASLLSAILTGALLGGFGVLPGEASGWVTGAIAGLVLNLASQAGDLLESKVKRTGGVKDSGTLFGPAGGVLDVVDSLLLSLPTALAVWPWLFG